MHTKFGISHSHCFRDLARQTHKLSALLIRFPFTSDIYGPMPINEDMFFASLKHTIYFSLGSRELLRGQIKKQG